MNSNNYANYLAEQLDKNITYNDYLLVCSFSTTNFTHNYSDYLAEQLDKNITYNDYLENTDEIKRKRLDRKISKQKRKRNGKLKDILRNI